MSPKAVSYFTNSKKYVKSEITVRVISRLTGDGLVVIDGEEHRRQRKILNPAFASHHIKDLIGTFWLKACELAKYWGDKIDSDAEFGKHGIGIDVSTALTRTTLDIIGLTGNPLLDIVDSGFGYDLGTLTDQRNSVAQAVNAIFNNSPEGLFLTLLMGVFPMADLLPFQYIKDTEDAKKVIIDAASLLIEKKLEDEKGDTHDILGRMLAENKRLEAIHEAGLSKDEIINQILTFLLAGYYLSLLD